MRSVPGRLVMKSALGRLLTDTTFRARWATDRILRRQASGEIADGAHIVSVLFRFNCFTFKSVSEFLLLVQSFVS